MAATLNIPQANFAVWQLLVRNAYCHCLICSRGNLCTTIYPYYYRYNSLPHTVAIVTMALNYATEKTVHCRHNETTVLKSGCASPCEAAVIAIGPFPVYTAHYYSHV